MSLFLWGLNWTSFAWVFSREFQTFSLFCQRFFSWLIFYFTLQDFGLVVPISWKKRGLLFRFFFFLKSNWLVQDLFFLLLNTFWSTELWKFFFFFKIYIDNYCSIYTTIITQLQYYNYNIIIIVVYILQ